ncbi:MurR/RpiR family transcriptional regulator [Halobacillus sp. MO56]
MSNQLIFIQEALDSCKPSEKKVADYILQHPDEVVNLSIQKLAEKTEVSEATIIRLSKKLKCKGFQDLKLTIAREMAVFETSTEKYQDIPDDDSIESLINNVSYNNIQSLENTLNILAPEDVEAAIQLMTKARKIAVYGIGASGFIAQDFKQKLTRIDNWCEVGLDIDAQLTISANLTKEDVAFGVSYSGQTRDIYESLKVAKENGATIITLTKMGENPVSTLADIALYTTSLEKNIRSGATSSRIAQLNVIDILFLGITRSNQAANIEALDKTRKVVKMIK